MRQQVKEVKVWSIRYALTKGVQLVSGEEYKEGWFHTKGQVLAPRYWAYTWEKAKELAEAMRVKKIQSLKRQIKKLEALQFDKPRGKE